MRDDDETPPVRQSREDKRLAAIERELRLRKDIVLETQAASFGHAANYVAVISFGGYAGLFTIWTLVRDHLNTTTTFWVGFLLGVSLLLFVCFEIFKTYSLSGIAMKQGQLLNTATTSEELQEGMKKIRREANEWNSSVMIPIWRATFPITVATGVLSGAILLWSFVVGLASGHL